MRRPLPAAALLLAAAVCLLGVAAAGSEPVGRKQRPSRASGLCGLSRVRAAETPPSHPRASYPPQAVGSTATRGPASPRPRSSRSSAGGSVEDTWEESRAFPRARAGPAAEAPPAAPGAVTALYFSGRREQLVLRPGAVLAQLPREEFTIEAWVKAEGGQNRRAVLAGVFDNCSHTVSDKGWTLGINVPDNTEKKDARFFFSLRTDRMKRSSTILSYHRYQFNAWTHVAATYNGHQMLLYVNGKRVARSPQQSGALHSPFMGSCRTLILGDDNSADEHNFRGHLALLTLWNVSLPQEKLQRAFLKKTEDQKAGMLFSARFSSLEQQWMTFRDGAYPLVESFQAPEPSVLSPLVPPLCGRTVCDNVELISHYNSHWPLRSVKVVRYRIVNIYDDDGLNPTVKQVEIDHQHQVLSKAFDHYNITWQLSIHKVFNSSLRHRLILLICEPSMIGNGYCDPQCKHSLTGYDGGDCRWPELCYASQLHNDVCNMGCNNKVNNFDDGDCCNPEVTDVRKTCFDPDSIHRAYMSVKELKKALRLNSTHFFNVYFAISFDYMLGVSTWPWEKIALSNLGGVALDPTYFSMPGYTNSMIHEFGHILGLFDVFKGEEEKKSCDDPCRETTPSFETGDLCADTAPTTPNKHCRDPDPIYDTCGEAHFSGTPFSNYMNYADDNCTDSFTPNQVARMHCYLDLVYKSWSQGGKPAPIPMPPVVIGQTKDSLTIHWPPPISGWLYERDSGNFCGDCAEDGTFSQYVYEASSPGISDNSGDRTPEEAEGPPDVDRPCEPSFHSWSPEFNLVNVSARTPCTQPLGCILELHFLHPVYPDSIMVWTTFVNPYFPKTFSDIEILTEHGDSVHLGPMDTFCDVPLTVKLHLNKRVSGVKLYTFDKHIEIDAALLISTPQSPLCSNCKPVRYRVLRDPPFLNGSPAMVTQLKRKFIDKEVKTGQLYRYQVQAVDEAAVGEASPPLIHIHGSPYCGDGKVSTSLKEECDDGDLIDGNGCSRTCKKEKGFHCVGEPSLCYVHDGDGICEPFEKGISMVDCGLHTPKGYTDQWASEAYFSQNKTVCPVSLVTGVPLVRECKPYNQDTLEYHSLKAWFPCANRDIIQDTNRKIVPLNDNITLEVCFSRPSMATSLIVFLTSDGTSGHSDGDQSKPTVVVHLNDISGHSHLLATYKLSCEQNPLIINITDSIAAHKITSALFSFSSLHVGISSVVLRAHSPSDPTSVINCLPEHEWHRCTQHTCRGNSTCGMPILDNANYASCNPSSPEYTRCIVSCDKGCVVHTSYGQPLYPLQKEYVLICNSGHWDRTVTCRSIDCHFPDQSHVLYAEFSCPQGTTYGKQCFFSCIKPAKLQGVSQRLTCQEDGLWSLPEAYCKMECDMPPPPVANAKVLEPRCLQGKHDVGSVCRYKCKPGYRVTETTSTEGKPGGKFLNIQCLENGFWEKGSCGPVHCKPPPPIFSGMYNCTKGFEFDSQCVLDCGPQSKRVPIVCTKDRLWTEEFKLCKDLQENCSPPEELNSVKYKCEQRLKIGSVCTTSCDWPLSPYDPVKLPKKVTADTMDHRLQPSKVQSIVCTGRLKWNPDPRNVHCIPSCEPYEADGWCDPINNRAYCRYDGGDCCASTVLSKKVDPPKHGKIPCQTFLKPSITGVEILHISQMMSLVVFYEDRQCDEAACKCRDPAAGGNQ